MLTVSTKMGIRNPLSFSPFQFLCGLTVRASAVLNGTHHDLYVVPTPTMGRKRKHFATALLTNGMLASNMSCKCWTHYFINYVRNFQRWVWLYIIFCLIYADFRTFKIAPFCSSNISIHLSPIYPDFIK